MVGGLRYFAGREAGQQEQYHHHHQNHNHVLIRLKGVFQHQHFKVMDLLGIHPRHLFFQTIAFGKDQIFTQQNAGRRANRIESLTDIQP